MASLPKPPLLHGPWNRRTAASNVAATTLPTNTPTLCETNLQTSLRTNSGWCFPTKWSSTSLNFSSLLLPSRRNATENPGSCATTPGTGDGHPSTNPPYLMLHLKQCNSDGHCTAFSPSYVMLILNLDLFEQLKLTSRTASIASSFAPWTACAWL